MKSASRLLFALCALTAADAALADGLPKNFPSTVRSLQEITNSHRISLPSDPWAGGPLYRGAEPNGFVSRLKEHKINQVLIFKNENKMGSVEAEKAELKANGYKEIASLDQPAGSGRYEFFHISFPWKDLGGFKPTCKYAVDGLRFIQRALKEAGNKAYFHCTVGEDRTGMLAGLYRVIFQNENPRDVYFGRGKDVQAFVADEEYAMPPQGEMCGRGYSSGNPAEGKTKDVAPILQKELTPVFTKLLYLIERGRLTPEILAKDPASICAKDPGKEPAYRKDARFRVKNWSCPATRNPLRLAN